MSHSHPFVQLRDPGMTFFDPVSKFHIAGEAVEQVPSMTPMTRDWIMKGGLKIVTQTQEEAAAPAPNPSGEAPAASSVEVPGKADDERSENEDETGEEHEEVGKPGEEDSEEFSAELTSLLGKSGEEDEDEVKKPKSSKKSR